MMDGQAALRQRGLRTETAAAHAVMIGANLREARRLSGRPREEICRALGIARESLMNWERGRTTAPLAVAPTIADLLNLSWTEMFRGCHPPRRAATAGAIRAAPEIMDVLRRIDALPPDARAQLRVMLTGGVYPCRS
jgi:transcriptional regulator with XRE-family HTH domain